MAEHTLTIRVATVEDVTAVRKLQAEIIPRAFAGGNTSEDFWRARCSTEEWATNKEAYNPLILGERSVVHLAEVNGTLRGFGYTVEDEIAANFVAESWRRRRIGSALMVFGLNAMQSWGYTEAWLGVAKHAKGPKQFYEACHFIAKSEEAMRLPMGHNGRPVEAQFAVEDIKMELDDVAETQRSLRQRLTIGEVAFEETVLIDLGLFQLFYAYVSRLILNHRVSLRKLHNKSLAWCLP
jgi:GNAT superfamily N-acetyltransferase